MLFSSLEFLYLFLPWTVIVYFLVPKRAKNSALLIASLVFYAFGDIKYIFLLLATVTANFIFGKLVDRRCRSAVSCRVFLFCAVAFNLLILGFFKYYDFAADLLPFLEPIGIALPIGISFYTFQTLSYVVDVYRGDVAPAGSFIELSTYTALFPQLIAGPIVRYKDVSNDLANRTHSFELAANGIRRFCAGLAKKVLLANYAGETWQRLASLPDGEMSTASAWLGALFYAFQIYFDFSGYSDMAIGLGKIFGFRFPENFNYPYISRSVSEFWRRWHVTLSSFFRDYVYISLGGNRKGRARTYLNLLVVWALTGLWHGAAINFILWGLYYFILIALEKAFLGALLQRLPKIMGHVYTLTAVIVGWMIFAADTLSYPFSEYIKTMFMIGNVPLWSDSVTYELAQNALLIVIMALASTPLPKYLISRLSDRSKKADNFALPTLSVLSLFLLLMSTAKLVSSGYNPFLYFRF